MKTLHQFKTQALKRPGVKKAYIELQPEFEIIKKLVIMRSKKGLTQREFAREIGIAQSALARFEAGKANPTLSFLQKITHGLGLKLSVR